MRTRLLDEIRQRRVKMGIRSSDMTLLAGINRQQYEKIENGGNPSLETLDKIVEGLDAEIMLIPKDRLREIRRILDPAYNSVVVPQKRLIDEDADEIPDPWAFLDEESHKP